MRLRRLAMMGVLLPGREGEDVLLSDGLLSQVDETQGEEAATLVVLWIH